VQSTAMGTTSVNASSDATATVARRDMARS
jgi:hypothetical protein